MTAIAIVGVALSVVFGAQLADTNTSARDGSALVAGRIETGYDFVGYLISDQQKVCAAALLSPDTIITAGHCLALTGGDNFYFGLGDFNFETSELNPVVFAKYPNEFNQEDGQGPDIAVAKLAVPVTGITQFAEIASPEENCQASIVAYGSGVESNATVDLFMKKSGEGCVRALTDSFLIEFNEQVGMCFGDSGGPIFAAPGSNEIIGVLSGGLIEPRLNRLVCDPGNIGLGIATASYENFVANFVDGDINGENVRVMEVNSDLPIEFSVDEIDSESGQISGNVYTNGTGVDRPSGLLTPEVLLLSAIGLVALGGLVVVTLFLK